MAEAQPCGGPPSQGHGAGLACHTPPGAQKSFKILRKNKHWSPHPHHKVEHSPGKLPKAPVAECKEAGAVHLHEKKSLFPDLINQSS